MGHNPSEHSSSSSSRPRPSSRQQGNSRRRSESRDSSRTRGFSSQRETTRTRSRPREVYVSDNDNFGSDNNEDIHWAEHYLQQRLRQLDHLRKNLPAPDRTTETQSDQNETLTPTDLIHREIKLTTEYYRNLLYAQSWDAKDKCIRQYTETVDNRRDFSLQSTSDITFQHASRHTNLLRKNKADVEQLVVSQSIQKICLSKTNACI